MTGIEADCGHGVATDGGYQIPSPNQTRKGHPTINTPDIVLATAAAAAMVVAAPGTAGADPTPPPSPPYVIQTPGGPAVGGLRTLPPRCTVQPRACSGNWNPDTGAWDFPGT